MDNFIDRFEKVIDFTGLSAYKLAKELGTSEAVISNIRSGKTKPSFDFLSKLLNKYKAINANWLYTGIGETTLNEPETTYKVSTPKNKLIPFYDVEAAAGANTVVDVMPVQNPSGSIDVGDLLSDSEAAIRIYGNSMTPNYPSGCVVGLREVRDGVVEFGNVYVIETTDNRYLKRLFKDKEGKGYLCYSDNNQVFADGIRKGEAYYEPFTIPFESIIRMYRVTGVIKRNENSPIITNNLKK